MTLNQVLDSIFQQSQSASELLNVIKAVAKKLQQLHAENISIVPVDANQIYYDQNDKTITIASTCCHSLSTALSEQQKAEQIAAVPLPDDYWRIFKHMYFSDAEVPVSFSLIADQQRERNRQQQPKVLQQEKNYWLWDEKSAQAMAILSRSSKKKLRKFSSVIKLIINNLFSLPKIFWVYRQLLTKVYKHPVRLSDRIAIAIHPSYWQHERVLLEELQNIPAFIRFYCHEGEPQWSEGIQLVRTLKQRGVKVMVALVQNRKAIIDKTRWNKFLEFIVPEVHQLVEWIEVGHAINRVKWGIWNSEEYAELCQAIFCYCQQYPKLRFIGPAVIDFEWYRIVDALKQLPKKIKFHALSQHLYVDRRGAPENFQGKFSTLEKCAVSKAIACVSKRCENRLVVSEFNWPIKNTGVYSPIGSPYTAPEWFRDMPGVTEEEYACYLIRYLTIALCSGLVEQAVIWRLSAHGYGLVDDLDNFRKRPAFNALRFYLEQLSTAKFIAKHHSASDLYLFEFNSNKHTILLAWTTKPAIDYEIPWQQATCFDLYGERLQLQETHVTLSSNPLYICKVV